MKLKLLLPFLFMAFAATAQKTYTLEPDAQKYLIINTTTYLPGDTIQLKGYFKAVAVYNLNGAAGKPIIITNVPGQTLVIGDSLWSGGSWGHGLAIRGSHHIQIFGRAKSSFKIIGSNSTVKDANGYPVRTAYFDLMIVEKSDNFIVHDIAIRHGGVGILAKTDTYGTTILNNFEFYNIDVYNTYNEAFYIGHTTSTPNSSGQFPFKLNNVKVHHNYVHDIGNDGIQIAAADNVEVYDNEVVNWGMKKEYDHSGGICMGSRMIGLNVHNNYVHDGFGNMLQVFSNGGGLAVIKNNLFTRNKLDGVIVRAASPLTLSFVNNTVSYAGENLIRVNGANSKVDLNKNILAGPLGGSAVTVLPKNFIYLENGGTVVDNDNIKTASGSDIAYVGYGYKATTTPIPDPPAPVAKVTISSNELATFIKALKAGTYEVSVGVDSVVRKVVVRVE